MEDSFDISVLEQSLDDKFDTIYYEGLTKEQHDYIYNALFELDKYVSNIIKEQVLPDGDLE